MGYSNLVSYTKLSPNCNKPRKYKINRFTPHCVVGQCSVERIGEIFETPTRQASCNYGIGKDGRIALIVDEDNRSWCSGGTIKGVQGYYGMSGSENDHYAITVEVASDAKHPYTFTDKAYNALIELCVDCCKRHNKNILVWISDPRQSCAYVPKDNEMLLTLHRFYANKACAGQWFIDHIPDFTKKVNDKLKPATTNQEEILYRVQVGAFKNVNNAKTLSEKLRVMGLGTYLIEKDGFYKVQIGAFKNLENAERLKEDMDRKGYACFITTNKGNTVR